VSALVVEDVWKRYPAWPAGTRTLRAVLSRRAPLLLRRGEGRWALQAVSFEMAPSESVGVIGHNGAGKSTLLRIACGLGQPTRGRVVVSRDTGSVLSIGSWFDVTLSGRENVLTAAMVLGFGRSQARTLIPAVLEFAELEDFADAPVRIYSEGMKLRLAFGVLAQLSPELLVVDEALAVGDLSFQAKCVDRIREMRSAGTGLLLASHDLSQVAAECDRVVWLDAGKVRRVGAAGAVVAAYRDAGRQETLARTPTSGSAHGPLALHVNRFGSQELTLENVVILGSDGMPSNTVSSGGSMSLSMELRPHRTDIADPIVNVTLIREIDDLVCAECSSLGALRLGKLEGPQAITLTLDRLDLRPGDYVLDVGVYPPDWSFAYDFHSRAYPFAVTGQPGGEGVLRPPQQWSSTADASRMARTQASRG
jgi:lipopolysaccharide transport system ATP-binding protein